MFDLSPMTSESSKGTIFLASHLEISQQGGGGGGWAEGVITPNPITPRP